MILVSCRRGFDSNHRFADALQVRRYPDLRDLGVFETLDEAALAEAVHARHVLVLVHGYRNPIKHVADAYRLVEQRLRGARIVGPDGYDEVLGFVWPGFETVLGFVFALPWANRSAGFFRTLLAAIGREALTVDVQTHSLGARVALQAMAFPHEVWVDTLLLTAAAVDNEALEPGREFHASLDACRRCLVYHSGKDRVLKVSYRIGAHDAALGHNGPEHPEVIAQAVPQVHVVDCTPVVASHGGYRRAAPFYAHWARVVAEDPLDQFDRLQP